MPFLAHPAGGQETTFYLRVAWWSQLIGLVRGYQWSDLWWVGNEGRCYLRGPHLNQRHTRQRSPTSSPIYYIVFLQYHIRPSLKIILFPVHRPGDPVSAEWVFFF